MSERLGELILYIAQKCQTDEAFGAIKLNKILFLSDFIAYAINAKSISGAKYIRQEMGPVPFELVRVRDQIIEEDRAVLQERLYFGKKQKRLIALDAPRLYLFDPDEIRIVDLVIEMCQSRNGTQLSDWTHTLRPWLSARNNEVIPYYTMFILNDGPVTSDMMEWGINRVMELKASGAVQ